MSIEYDSKAEKSKAVRHEKPFTRFQVQHNLPKNSNTRNHGSRDFLKMPTIFGSFEEGLQHGKLQNERIVRRKDVASGLTETKFKKHMPKPVPIAEGFFIEKYALKDRYNVAKIHKKICKHCRFENVLCTLKDDVEFMSMEQPAYLKVASRNEEMLQLRSKFFQQETDEHSSDYETETIWPLVTERKQKKIVVKLPQTFSDEASEIGDEAEVPARAIFSYTHTKR